MADRKRKGLGSIGGAAALLFIAALWVYPAYCFKQPEAPRMAREQLRRLLDDPDTLILDVRLPDDWKVSKSKIPGAIRVDPNNDLATLMEKLPKDKTLVFYCS